ncbi:MAG: FTR1 family iron permease [Spirochaetales bacterium]|jgi:high-affinity iron transporter|nr:FTR1 family iron permease [Spirochaetales bacterium]
MAKKLAVLTLIIFLGGMAAADETWELVEREMRLLLSESYYRFTAGDIAGAKTLVDEAYTGYYKGLDFERNVKILISEGRAQNIDDWFEYVKDALGAGKSQKEIREDINQLTHLLRVTARRLDGKEEPSAAARNWTKTADEMGAVLNKAYDIYAAGNPDGAKDQVDVAYFGYYEKLGFEKIVMSRISGDRATKVEYLFSLIKKAMMNKSPNAEVRENLDLLISLLREDATQLDGRTESAVGVFIEALLIITREGFEAILIVGAIIAYLIKSGNKDKTKAVYWGSLIALAASVLMAFILGSILRDSGENQEIIEGLTMLIAVAVLFYVSNWMVSKAEAQAWTTYIEGKVQSSISRGSIFSLAFAAFLAVFREGAETILFYQAILANTQTYFNMVWTGLGVGCVLLVVIYILIRFLSIKIPLKPFFLGTSVLLFIMSIAFTGSGIKELQEGNVISVTPLPGTGFSIDILGIYPTLETLSPQLVLLAIAAATFIIQIRRWKTARTAKAAA